MNIEGLSPNQQYTVTVKTLQGTEVAQVESTVTEPNYKVVVGSDSGHCCFQYTVMDVTRDESICECFDPESAQMIADSLNA